MFKPSTVEEFGKMLSTMNHRERFVFSASDVAKTEHSSDAVAIEIYSTQITDKNSLLNELLSTGEKVTSAIIAKHSTINIKVSAVDKLGKEIPNSARSKQLRKINKKHFEEIYNLVK